MIRVSVHLLSAVSADRSRELARMDIANDGYQTAKVFSLGTYEGTTYRGRDTDALNRGVPMHRAQVQNWPREQLHVWNLVRTMLEAMGYKKTKRCVALLSTPVSDVRAAFELGRSTTCMAEADAAAVYDLVFGADD